MNANTQTQQTEARAIQAPTLEAADPTKNLILVSLSRLVSRRPGATCATRACPFPNWPHPSSVWACCKT